MAVYFCHLCGRPKAYIIVPASATRNATTTGVVARTTAAINASPKPYDPRSLAISGALASNSAAPLKICEEFPIVRSRSDFVGRRYVWIFDVFDQCIAC